MATTPTKNQTPEPTPSKDDVASVKAQLLADLRAELPSRDELLEQVRAQLIAEGFTPPKAKPKSLPYEPPADGAMRVKIRSLRGKPATMKASIYDDSRVPHPQGKVHGYLHFGQVVDIPKDLVKQVRPALRALFAADILEECPREPATRPFFYDSHADAKAADPRFKGSKAEAEASIDRITMSAQRRRQVAGTAEDARRIAEGD